MTLFTGQELMTLISNLSYTRSVSSDIQTPRSELKNEVISEFFSTNFEVFRYLMKHDFRVYDISSQTNSNLKRNSSLKSSKFYAH